MLASSRCKYIKRVIVARQLARLGIAPAIAPCHLELGVAISLRPSAAVSAVASACRAEIGKYCLVAPLGAGLGGEATNAAARAS